mgnify:CR=1 FL=1
MAHELPQEADPQPAEESCAWCRWWHKEPGMNWGACRRFPKHIECSGRWWCAEFTILPDFAQPGVRQ